MRTPEQTDTFVLLDGGKEWKLPGLAQVEAGLNANNDTLEAPGDEDAVTQLQEATGDVEVKLTMWEHEQWDQYQHVLNRLRRGTEEGPAVFGCSHPEVRARRMKRLYFVAEQAQPYTPKDGYRTTLKFSEKQKAKAAVKGTGDADSDGISAALGIAAGTQAGADAARARVVQAATAALVGRPAPADGGRATTAQGGYCSAWARAAGVSAGLDPKLFGVSAQATEANFRQANLSRTWDAASLRELQPGDFVFWGNDPSGFGHVGIVIGRAADGMPLIAGNNLVTYLKNGGRLSPEGKAIDRNIDARGVERLDHLSTPRSQPTSVGRPGGFPSTPRVQGPAAPLRPDRPSLTPPRVGR